MENKITINRRRRVRAKKEHAKTPITADVYTANEEYATTMTRRDGTEKKRTWSIGD